MSQAAITVQGLGKEYSIQGRARKHETFYDFLAHQLMRPFSGGSTPAAQERFWALRDIDFQLDAGEVVGVIGRNGAGKSTLLKILSRITAPTCGRVEIRGRLASLLEVGTGFHPELSGRENIYLNGAILGMSRSEINRKFDDIVQFAEVERFLDTPVKRYSSGMYVRLAFAVSAHLDVDVLVVDEVLAVGDASFQERCLNKMEDVSRTGRTVVFVSHNVAAVSRLCERALLLHAGRIAFDGATASAIAAYATLAQDSAVDLHKGASGTLGSKVEVLGVTINGSRQLFGTAWQPSQEIRISISTRVRESLRKFRVSFCVFKGQQLVFSLHDTEEATDIDNCSVESTVVIPSHFLSPGQYGLDIQLYSDATGEWLGIPGAALFAISTQWDRLYEPTQLMGVVNLRQVGTRRIIAGAESPEPMMRAVSET